MPATRQFPGPLARRRPPGWLPLVLALALIGSSLMLSPAARAASIIVTTLNDTVDAGSCNTLTIASLPGTDHLVSLREAICAANNTAGADTITFQTGMFGTITLTGGESVITTDVTITGPGATNSRSAGTMLAGL